jgi:hypothetical protein
LIGQTQRLLTFIRTQYKWFTRLPVFLILLLAVPNPITHAIIEGGGRLLGFEEPSLATLIGVAMLFLILERVIVIEDDIEQLMKSGPLRVDQREKAKMGDLLLDQRNQELKVRHVDILQFTGFALGDFFGAVANHKPARVRLLLCHPELAKTFDEDWKDHNTGRQVHEARIYGTLDRIEMLKRDWKNRGFDFSVDIRYYRTMPSVSAVILDDKKVSLGWYKYFADAKKPKVMRIEGHSSATISGNGDLANPLLSFARTQFDALWKTGEEVRSNARTDQDLSNEQTALPRIGT